MKKTVGISKSKLEEKFGKVDKKPVFIGDKNTEQKPEKKEEK